MPRRASSNPRLGPVISALFVAVLLTAAGWWFLAKETTPFAGTVPLELHTFLENGKSLQGNVYTIEGTLDEQLKWTPDSGRLISLLVGEGRDRTPLPVMIPQELSGQNLQQGQAFVMKIEVGRDGLLVAQAIEKI